MENEINKPISVVYADFIEQILKIINTSRLPLFVVESVLKDIYNDVRILSQKQYEEDLRKYTEKLNADSEQ